MEQLMFTDKIVLAYIVAILSRNVVDEEDISLIKEFIVDTEKLHPNQIPPSLSRIGIHGGMDICVATKFIKYFVDDVHTLGEMITKNFLTLPDVKENEPYVPRDILEQDLTPLFYYAIFNKITKRAPLRKFKDIVKKQCSGSGKKLKNNHNRFLFAEECLRQRYEQIPNSVQFVMYDD